MARTMLKYADIEKKIQKYFDECDALNGGEKKLVKPYTLSGLICSMGVTRTEFEKLMRNKKDAQKLYGAKAKIEAFIEENALIGGLSANSGVGLLVLFKNRANLKKNLLKPNIIERGVDKSASLSI